MKNRIKNLSSVLFEKKANVSGDQGSSGHPAPPPREQPELVVGEDDRKERKKGKRHKF